MPALVTNNASGTLASGITAVATTMSLGTGQGALFPAASGTSVFWATLINSSNQLEIVKVTAKSGDTFTIVRGQDGSTARAYSTGDKIELRPTAALFNAKLDADTAALTYAPLGGTGASGTWPISVSGNAATASNATNLGGNAASTYAPLASPTFTGTPAGPTAATGTNTTQLATTAFVLQNGFPAGTRLAFQQTAAPTFWTKDTTAAIDDAILRLVTGTVGSGGSTAFSSFNSQSSVGATTLDGNMIPSHSHSLSSIYASSGKAIGAGDGAFSGTRSSPSGYSTQATGGGGSHSHGITTNIKYYDFIIASKN